MAVIHWMSPIRKKTIYYLPGMFGKTRYANLFLIFPAFTEKYFPASLQFYQKYQFKEEQEFCELVIHELK
jgi:hypothetical protein